jgi:putative membrane protein
MLVTATLVGAIAFACDNPNSTQIQAAPAAPAKESTAATPAGTPSEKTGDAAFVEKAAVAGLFEIETSQLAMTRAVKTDLQGFAQMMVTDHNTANNELKDLVGSGQIQDVTHVPNALDAEHQGKLEELKAAANGPAFDKKYHELQLEGHKQAVALFEAHAKNGDNAALKDWAVKTLPKLKDHLTRIQGITP